MSRTRFFLTLEIATLIGAAGLCFGVIRPFVTRPSPAPRLSSVELNTKLMQTLKICRGDVDFEVVRTLLKQGASPNSTNAGNDSMTALIVAAGKGQPGIVKLLLDSGAEVNSKAKLLVKGDNNSFVLDGVTALSTAALSGNAPVLKMLIDHGADVHALDSRGQSIMLWARSNEVVQILLDQGLDINSRDVDGFTLLILSSTAFAEGDPHRFAASRALGSGIPDVSFLLERGADPNVKAKSGVTPLNASQGRPELVELLKKAGAKE